jgi:hypothetical protein
MRIKSLAEVREFNRQAAKASDFDALFPICQDLLDRYGLTVNLPAEEHDCVPDRFGCAQCQKILFARWHRIRRAMQACSPKGHQFGAHPDNARRFGFWPTEA